MLEKEIERERGALEGVTRGGGKVGRGDRVITWALPCLRQHRTAGDVGVNYRSEFLCGRFSQSF